MEEVKKNILNLTIFLLVSSFVVIALASAQIMVFFGPNASGTNLSLGNGTNWSTTILLNVTFVNGTDIMITNNANNLSSINASFYTNISNVQTFLNYSTTCGVVNVTNNVFACWANITIGNNTASTFTENNTYNITVVLRNGTGGAGTTGTTVNASNATFLRRVTFDNTAPNVSAANISTGANAIPLLQGGNYSDFQTGLLNINVSIFDGISTVSNVFFNITNASGTQNGTVTASNSAGAQWNATINVTNYPDGKYNVTVFATDYAGNLNGSAAVSVLTFDNSPPGLTFSCSPASVPSGTNTNCTCTATEPNSGLNATYNSSNTNLGTSYTVNPSVTSTGTFSTTCNGGNVVGLTSSLSTTYTVTVVSVSGSSSSSAGSSGAGGGSAPSGKSSSIIDQINPGVAKITQIMAQDSGINQISIEVNSQASNVQLSVIKYNGKPATVTVEKTGKVYKYMDIKADNLADKLKKATITIQVEKSWATSNNVAKENIALFHLTNNQWTELPTIFKSEDDKYYYYTADTPSFSFFAIGDKTSSTGAATQPSNGQPGSTTPEAGAATSTSKTTWIVLILVIIIIVALIIWMMKKKR